MAAIRVPLERSPRRFRSPREAAESALGVWVRAPRLWSAYLGGLDRGVRERVMVAVSRANACAACTAVHERWALRSGITDDELDAIGLGELAQLDHRSRLCHRPRRRRVPRLAGSRARRTGAASPDGIRGSDGGGGRSCHGVREPDCQHGARYEHPTQPTSSSSVREVVAIAARRRATRRYVGHDDHAIDGHRAPPRSGTRAQSVRQTPRGHVRSSGRAGSSRLGSG